ncbi:hypothetical protein [Sinimarinibacterium flocculans]|uniref:hypothetical protein n=1 Tax=Sinimarinibacterium flocculans TaxID=985250 RepID=UPI002490EF16|nr:hypothetical protein [Sinimarinibacterium flocculans]
MSKRKKTGTPLDILGKPVKRTGQSDARKREGRVRKKEAQKRVAKQEAVKYPRDPGARAQLEGKEKRKANREARRQNNTETEKQKQRYRQAAFKQLLKGERRFLTADEKKIRKIPTPSTDLLKTTKDSREEQKKMLAPKKKGPSWLSQIAQVKRGVDVLTQPVFKTAYERIFAPMALEGGKQGAKEITKPVPQSSTKPGQVKQSGGIPGLDLGKIFGTGTKAIKSVTKDAATTLDITARPSYAISSATGAALKGEDVPKAAVKGIKGKERGGFSKVLREQGAPDKWYVTIAGLGLDIALDPTTYISVGAAPVATKAGNKAAAQVSKQIRKEGTEAVAAKWGLAASTSRDDIMRAVRDRVEKEVIEKIGHNKKGLQVGLSTKGTRGISTSGRMSSKVNQKLGGSKVATKTRENKVVDFLGEIAAPDWRPKGVSPKAWREARHSVTRTRGTVDAGTSAGVRFQRAARKVGLSETPEPKTWRQKIRSGTSKKVGPQRNRPANRSEEVFFARERGESSDAIDGLGRWLGRDLERKKGAGLLDEGFQVGKVPKVERTRIKAEHTKAVSKTKSMLDDQKYALEVIKREKAEALLAKDTDKHTKLLGAQARVEQQIENLEATRIALREMKVDKLPAEDWLEYTARLERQTEKIAPDMANYVKQIRAAQAKGAKKYNPHIANKNMDPIDDVTEFIQRPGTTTASKEHERALMHSVENMRKTSPLAQVPGESSAFSTDIGNIGRYTSQRTSVNVALANHWNHIKKHAGRAVKEGEDLTKIPDDYAVFAIGKAHPGHISAPIRNTDVAKLAEISRKPADHVILPTALVDQTRRALRPSVVRRGKYGVPFEKASGSLKAVYTKWNIPSYHTVNMVGDVGFMQQANTPLWRGLKNASVLKKAHLARNKAEQSGDIFKGGDFSPEILKKTHRVGDVEQSLGKWLDEIEQYDIVMQGHIGREITELTGKDTWLNRFFAGREDLPRMASYMHARGKGMLPEDAAVHVFKHHINYNDLTEFEKMLRSLPVPFVSFLARNTRIQISQLFQRPGKFASVAKGLNSAAQLSGYESYMDFYDSLNDYQKTSLLLPLGKDKKPVGTQLPIELGLDPLSLDLDRVATTVFSALFMPLKAVTELKQNKQFFNDREIVEENPFSSGKKRGGLMNTGPLTGWPLSQLGIAQKNAKGDYVIPAQLQYILNQTPQSSTLNRAGYEDNGGRSWIDSLMAVGGFKKQAAPNKEKVAKNKSYDQQDNYGTAYERAKELYGEKDPRTIRAKAKFNEAKKKNRKPTTKTGGWGNSSGGGTGWGTAGGGSTGW